MTCEVRFIQSPPRPTGRAPPVPECLSTLWSPICSLLGEALVNDSRDCVYDGHNLVCLLCPEQGWSGGVFALLFVQVEPCCGCAGSLYLGVCLWVSAHCLGCSVFLALPWWSGRAAEVTVAHRLSQLGTFLRTSSCSSLLFVFLLFLVPFLPFNF